MDEYIRREDAIEVINQGRLTKLIDADVAESGLKGIPAADVVSVVRCRKCKYFWTYQCMDSMPIEMCALNQIFYDPDIDFCSLAERREE